MRPDRGEDAAMKLSTFDSFKTSAAPGTRELSGEELRSLQLRLCEILDDIVAVCEGEKVEWTLGGGSALGAVRHRGFIPWDDDLDVNMPRGEWRRFRAAFEKRFGGKYVIYEPGRPGCYPLAFPSIRLRGTSYVTREDMLEPGIESGVFVDVFLLEGTFDLKILRAVHGFGSLALGFLYSCRKHFHERRLLRKMGLDGAAFRMKRLLGLFLAFLPLGAWTRLWDCWNSLCRNAESRFATFPVGRRHFFGELALREGMRGTGEGVFEGRKVCLPADVGAYMKRLYGDGYMTPPPEGLRESHHVFPPFVVGGVKSDLKVLVATHKPYAMPSDPSYLPIFVGAELADTAASATGFRRDDEGDGISGRNRNWCELTALYWAWKNLAGADAVGLVHYRRHFKGRRGIATGAEICSALVGVDAVLPRPRNYFIETTYSHYAHAHHAIDLDETRRIVAERHPDCLEAFDSVMKSTRGHRFNMAVMRRSVFDDYCGWLFRLLFELERRLDISSYSIYDARVFGFVSERLLDVYVVAKKVSFSEMPVLNLESEHWPRKIVAFLKRKLRAGK